MRPILFILMCTLLANCNNLANQPDKSHLPVSNSSVISNAPSGDSISATKPYVMFVRDGKTLSRLDIEIPLPSEYSTGFSKRSKIGNQGMLFLYPNGQTGPFWMQDTYFNLAIAWIDIDNKIMGIDTMIADTEEYHHPPGRYFAALEVPERWYITNGIQIGDTVIFYYDPSDVGLK